MKLSIKKILLIKKINIPQSKILSSGTKTRWIKVNFFSYRKLFEVRWKEKLVKGKLGTPDTRRSMRASQAQLCEWYLPSGFLRTLCEIQGDFSVCCWQGMDALWLFASWKTCCLHRRNFLYTGMHVCMEFTHGLEDYVLDSWSLAITLFKSLKLA